jgi:ribosomal-protein-alanine N-acetyltransferase
MRINRKNEIKYSQIKISGRRLLLRPYTFSDFKILRVSHNERLPKLNKFDEPVAPASESEFIKFKERVRRYRYLAEEGHQFIFGIFDIKSKAYIGQVDILTLNKQLRWGNLGYHIQNQYFGKGYATEAAKLGLNISFQFLNFHRIESATEVANKASKKVALKAGLILEGKRAKFFANEGGIDMVVYATNVIDYK